MRATYTLTLVTIVAAGILASCRSDADTVTHQPGSHSNVVPIAFGVDHCDYCDRTISEIRSGGELITRDGEVYKFASIECMAGFYLEGRVRPDEVESLWVVDFNHGTRLIDATDALYLQTDNRPNPQDLNLLAVDSEELAWNLHFAYGGTRMNWDSVLVYVKENWEL